MSRAPRRCSERRWLKMPRSRRSPRIWPTCSTGTAATMRRLTPTNGRQSSIPSWATISTSSSATSPTSGETRSREGELGPGGLAQSGPPAGPGQPRDAGSGPVSPYDAAFTALTRKISLEAGPGAATPTRTSACAGASRVRMRACGVHTYADYLTVLDREPGGVRTAPRHPHDQRHPLLSKRRYLERSSAPACCPKSGRHDRAGERLERGLFLRRGALHPRHAHGGPGRPPGSS